MRIFAICVLLAGLGIASVIAAAAQDNPGIKIVPPTNVSAASGPEMFNTYCAVCHGKSGKGDGPAAKSLKNPPADLTHISSLNHGQFPELRVQQSINMEHEIGAHGNQEMPMWGPVFKSIDSSDAIWRLRINNLTQYVRSIQAK